MRQHDPPLLETKGQGVVLCASGVKEQTRRNNYKPFFLCNRESQKENQGFSLWVNFMFYFSFNRIFTGKYDNSLETNVYSWLTSTLAPAALLLLTPF